MRTRVAAVVTAAVVIAFLLGVAGPAGAAPKGGIGALTMSPNPVDEGSTATLSGNLDTQCSSSDLHIDWGDGTSDDLGNVPPGPFPAAGSTIPHVYADDDPTGTSSDDYTVTASFTSSTPGCADQGGATTKVTVQNVNPSVDSLDVFARGPRQTTSLQGTFSDGGTQDSYTVTINWGDGSANTVLLLPAIQKIRTGHAYAASGQYRIGVVVQDDDTGVGRGHVDVTVPVMSPRLITGAGAGGGPLVKVFDGTASTLGSFFAYRSSFTGGVRVAAGDVNGDGVADIVTAPGPGGPPLVEVWSGTDGSLLDSFLAYRSSFTGGVFVAAGDLNGDGRAEVITGPDAGGPPLVRVFAMRRGGLAPVDTFFAFRSSFTGGVRVAVGDVDGDGARDIIVGAGPGAGPHVKVFDGTGGVLDSFLAYQSSFTGGLYVAAGDLNGDGVDEIITGAGAGGGPHVKAFATGGGGFSPTASFFAYPSGFTGGVRVAVGDLNGDGSSEIIVAPGAGGGPLVKAFDSQGNTTLSFFAYQSSFTGGVFIGFGEVPQGAGGP